MNFPNNAKNPKLTSATGIVAIAIITGISGYSNKRGAYKKLGISNTHNKIDSNAIVL